MSNVNRFLLILACSALLPLAVNAQSAIVPATRAAAEEAGKAVADTAELSAFKAAIRQKYAMKEQAFAAHDAETIVTRFYTDDVVSIGEGAGIFVGRDAIRPLYREVVKHYTAKVDSVHTYVNGEAGWDWADFHVRPIDTKEKPYSFAILFLWTKVDGEWMCKGDFFMLGSVRDRMLAPPAAPAPPAPPEPK